MLSDTVLVYNNKNKTMLRYKFGSVYKTGESVGGPKMGEPWHTRKQSLACLTCALCGARTHTRHSGEMIE